MKESIFDVFFSLIMNGEIGNLYEFAFMMYSNKQYTSELNLCQ